MSVQTNPQFNLNSEEVTVNTFVFLMLVDDQVLLPVGSTVSQALDSNLCSKLN